MTLPDGPGVADMTAAWPTHIAAGGWMVATSLALLADTWPVVTDPDELPALQTRCGDESCSQQIFPANLQGRLTHLMKSHGYRMDGTAYDNDNRVVTTAREELTARAGR